MKQQFIINSISVFILLLFLYTGVAKLMNVSLFRDQILSAPLLAWTGKSAIFLAWSLPILEITVAVVLAFPAWRLTGLYSSLAIMMLFTFYVIAMLFVDNQLSCSCGGVIEELPPWQHLLFNLACVILCMVAIRIIRRPSNPFHWSIHSSVLGLFALIGWIVFSAFSAPVNVKTGMEGRLMPSFDLLLTDSSTHVDPSTFAPGQPTIVIGFSPFCPHCQLETLAITKNIEKLKNTRILFVTIWPFAAMKTFDTIYKLPAYPNITMGKDLHRFFLHYLKATGIPTTAVYDSKNRLKQVFSGSVQIDQIIKAATE